MKLEPLPEAVAPLQAFIDRALEYTPEARFASATEMNGALSDIYLDDLFF